MINSFPDPFIKTNKKLNRNPLYKFLFKCGYLGTEDLYEYWEKNQGKVLRLYKNEVDEDVFKEDVKEFKHKVIWSTPLGIFLRFEIKKYLRCNSNIKTDFNEVTTRYGYDRINILDFNNIYNKMENTAKTDLRGTALIKAHFNHVTIENVNFDYASLDGCLFEQATFKNCSFKYASFTGTKMVDSVFEKDCVFYKNRFYNTVVKSEFKCNISKAMIIEMKRLFLSRKEIISNLKFPSYTIILSPSFVQKANSNEIRRQHERQKKFQIDSINDYAIVYEG